MMKRGSYSGIVAIVVAWATVAPNDSVYGQTADFQLLTWDGTVATVQLPSAVEVKPSQGLPATGDWLVFTGDDQALSGGYNAAGAISHNLADLSGAGGAGFNNAPSLSGSLTLDFASTGPDSWDVSLTAQSYTGQATPVMYMNQFLVAPGSGATQNPAFNVDGVGNSGAWSASAANDWSIAYQADFYFATNADGDPSPTDIDATFDDKTQNGYLIPVDQLTPAGMALVNLDDPAGFFGGDFEEYLLEEIAPRLPGDATYLLVTQMEKVNPGYAETGLPVTTSSLIGNTTIAYTTSVIPEPAAGLLLATGWGIVGLGGRRRRRGPG